ncbi:SDR family oxidoreductase [Litorimonas haliclonae]|uniref:SDR family oxidoreductase n=1 Tax=Litorimonas haliclonae TaxID=2081977 RepID=UPI0039F0D636
MARFSNKNVLITGGSSGIGLATARRVTEEGGRVMVTGRSEDHLNDAKKVLPDSAVVLKNDASDVDAADELAQSAKDFGKLDAVFLNAGYGDFRPVEKSDADFFDAMNNVNVRGPVLHLKALKDNIANPSSVLVTASVSSYIGQANGAVYAGTKGAVTGMARAWAAELADKNIRVNTIAPGPIETNFFNSIDMPDDEVEKMVENIKSNVALGRLGTAEEVAAVATFLLSDDSSYVTGSQYMVDGGMTYR